MWLICLFSLIALHHFCERPIDSEQQEKYKFILNHLGLSDVRANIWNKQSFKRMLFNKTRQYNIDIFTKINFF